MQFVAIVERRLMHWYVYIPALATGGPVPEPNDVQASAVALVAAATSVPAADLQVSLHLAGQGDMLLSTAHSEVEVRHKGVWRTAQHTGWLRQWSGSWRPLVSYAADSALWTCAVHASCFRPSAAKFAAVPAPRASVEPVRLARVSGG